MPDTDDASPRFVARAAHVFNAAQVDGAKDLAQSHPSETVDPPVVFTAFVRSTGAIIREDGARACYVPKIDTILLPLRSAFHSLEGYAATLAHELVHWTGARHRLARDLTDCFGSQAYAAEELVAELGAAFVLADLGVARAPHPDHAAYCAAWASLLCSEPRALATAASEASRAVDYLAALQVGRTTRDALSRDTDPLDQSTDGAGRFIQAAA
ncbi:zincin-like metallopeptidase domain-containing protein [Methylobacterium nigriterrae]|uniref:zincin-like metallopeptidase domain-containing protein n=1 Tax=Methylobacterium nigriterrae TaxID=3127512 RepID=UPI0030134579